MKCGVIPDRTPRGMILKFERFFYLSISLFGWVLVLGLDTYH